MATEEKELIQNTINRNEFFQTAYELLDTILKIKKIENVNSLYISNGMTDIYVVTEYDDVDTSENIMEQFANWEVSYKMFPELHVINKNETFYIPAGAKCI